MQIHVVRQGETLYRLAQRYGVTVEQIVAENSVANPNVLIVGQALVIPVPPGVYIVEPGDSLWAIAQRLGTTVAVLARENGIFDPNVLRVGQRLRVTAAPLPTIESNGYFVDFGPVGQQSLTDGGPYLTYASPFSYHVTETGALVPLADDAWLSAARAQRVVPLLVITNWREGKAFDSDLAHAILTSDAVRRTLVANILSTLRSKGFGGLNIDFEYVYPQDREFYNSFLAQVAVSLHAAGYPLSTALAPKYSANQPGILYEAHDYPVHGKWDDFVVLMTYEWGYAGGPPWAISPVNEVERVLDYAVSVMPSEKILMGISLYGRDWTLPYRPGTLAQTLSPQALLDRAAQYGVSIQYNTVYQAPYYQYVDAQGRTHQVWFEDARSTQAKYDLVQRYGLRGVSFWVLPVDFPQNWPVLASLFQVRKRA